MFSEYNIAKYNRLPMHLWCLFILNHQIRNCFEKKSTYINSTSDAMGSANSIPESTNWHVEYNSQVSIDETGNCRNVVSGTSNQNFLQYRHLKKVHNVLSLKSVTFFDN